LEEGREQTEEGGQPSAGPMAEMVLPKRILLKQIPHIAENPIYRVDKERDRTNPMKGIRVYNNEEPNTYP
jgi:hypothetical protein